MGSDPSKESKSVPGSLIEEENILDTMLAIQEGDHVEKSLLPGLPLNVWLKIFSCLTRNDLDNCLMVCRLWRRIICRNSKFLPKRVIEYLVLSTHRCFSIQACAESKIKTFTFPKYFSKETMWMNINDRSLMQVQTIRKGGLHDDKLFRYLSLDLSERTKMLVNPHAIIKRRHRTYTPPTAFFKVLRSVLQNMGEIKHLAFYKFLMTDSFLEKMLFHVDLPLCVTNLHLHAIKRRDNVMTRINGGVGYVTFISELIHETRPKIKETRPLPGQQAQQAGANNPNHVQGQAVRFPPPVQMPPPANPLVQEAITLMRHRLQQRIGENRENQLHVNAVIEAMRVQMERRQFLERMMDARAGNRDWFLGRRVRNNPVQDVQPGPAAPQPPQRDPLAGRDPQAFLNELRQLGLRQEDIQEIVAFGFNNAEIREFYMGFVNQQPFDEGNRQHVAIQRRALRRDVLDHFNLGFVVPPARPADEDANNRHRLQVIDMMDELMEIGELDRDE